MLLCLSPTLLRIAWDFWSVEKECLHEYNVRLCCVLRMLWSRRVSAVFQHGQADVRCCWRSLPYGLFVWLRCYLWRLSLRMQVSVHQSERIDAPFVLAPLKKSWSSLKARTVALSLNKCNMIKYMGYGRKVKNVRPVPLTTLSFLLWWKTSCF